jgi:hypothetical protein
VLALAIARRGGGLRLPLTSGGAIVDTQIRRKATWTEADATLSGCGAPSSIAAWRDFRSEKDHLRAKKMDPGTAIIGSKSALRQG